MTWNTVQPMKVRYKKSCECGKEFYCDGICEKNEEMKNRLHSCYCPECFINEWGEKMLCASRKRLFKNTIIHERVQFT